LIFYIIEYIFAALPRTQRGQPLVLGSDPKGKNFLYTNGNSVIIRNIDVSFYCNKCSLMSNNRMNLCISLNFAESSNCRCLYGTFLPCKCCQIFS